MKVRYVAALACGLGIACLAGDWNQDLWLGRGEIWRARFPLTLTNPTDESVVGVPAGIRVGTKKGEAPLVNALAESIRVTDDRGVQLLYGIWQPDGRTMMKKGPIPEGATLVVPAVCTNRTSVRYTVYFDNAQAWPLMDTFKTPVAVDLNGDFEQGDALPAGWQTSGIGDGYALSLVKENPFSGNFCVKAQVPIGKKAAWFGLSRTDFAVKAGSTVTLRVRVRGDQVVGTAGWYVHVGNAKNSQVINKVYTTGSGTFDWKEQVITVTIPEACTRLSTGSVLYGTGTAWYDDFHFECDQKAATVTAVAGDVERLAFMEEGVGSTWPSEKMAWLYRIPLRLANFSQTATGEVLASADLNMAARGIAHPVYRLRFKGQDITTCRLSSRLLFKASVPAQTRQTYYLYVADSGEKGEPEKQHVSKLGSDIPSDHVLVEQSTEVDAQAFTELLNGPHNLVKNGSFEQGSPLPEAWSGALKKEDGVTFKVSTPGGFGKQCGTLTVDERVPANWRGWRQSVPVEGGKSYLYGAWLATEEVKGSAQLHLHVKDAKGATVPGGFLSAGTAIGGTTRWTPMFGVTAADAGVARFDLQLTMNASGTLKHDGVLVAACLDAHAGAIESLPLDADAMEVWPVNPIIKVFHNTIPPQAAPSAAIALAKNEEETLQLAVRAGRTHERVRIEIDGPTFKKNTLSPKIGWVGYVPIDHRSSYYNSTTPEWELKFPRSTGSSDGWSGWWPDPVCPVAGGRLVANQTQPIWISFKTTAETLPGLYRGTLRVIAGDTVVKKVPFQVRVWDFALPARPSCTAIYDVRLNHSWTEGQPSREAALDHILSFMSEKKLNPDSVEADVTFKRGADGAITADFAAYDRAAKRYFDELGFKKSYTPNFFYIFGWEHPPKNVLGEKPYAAEYPYTTVDRTQLRPEYKRVYQACLRLFWTHVKQMGWADKLVLYISDEPHMSKKHIVDQMKAACDMIHEVDRSIPIYCSTWTYCPDWNNYLDIWGVGHYGCFPVETMQAQKAAGHKIWFTTDGQLCTDTPFNAVERLLPHYCFKYGADAYEFWGATWFTYDPWEYGSHAFIHQTSTPGEYYYVRYPNGDGYLMYPGSRYHQAEPITTIRLEAARDGVEDYDYLLKLQRCAAKYPEAKALLDEFGALIDIPNAGGRFSSRILPDPDRLIHLRMKAGDFLSGKDQ